MEGKIGRPLKYGGLFEKLEPYTIYAAGSISDFAAFIGYIHHNDPNRVALLRRIRSSCGYIIKKYDFPAEGDGQVVIKGQRPTPGWYGWRWQEAIRSNRKAHRNNQLRAMRRKNKKKKVDR